MGIRVEDLDEPRATLVGDLGNRACERKMVGMGADAEQLPRLKVDADLDHESCVPGDSLLGCHARQPTTLRTPFSTTLARRRGSVPAVLLTDHDHGQGGPADRRRGVRCLGLDHRNLDPEAEPRFPAHADRVRAGLEPVPRRAAGHRVLGHDDPGGRDGGGGDDARRDDACGDDAHRDDADRDVNGGNDHGGDLDGGNDGPRRRRRGDDTGGRRRAAGKEVFAANCVSCHTLADAGATGTVGPNLDERKPSADHVVERSRRARA